MRPACQIPRVDDATFDRCVLTPASPVVVNFIGQNCRGCHLMDSSLQEMVVDRRPDGAQCYCVDPAACPAVAAQYGVTEFPTILVFRGGRVVRRLIGPAPSGELEIILRSELALPFPIP